MPVIDRRLVDQRRGGAASSCWRRDSRAAARAIRRRDRSAGPVEVGGARAQLGRARASSASRRVSARARWRGRSTPTSTIPAAAASTIRGSAVTSSRSTWGCSTPLGRRAGARLNFRSSASDSAVARAMHERTGGRYALLNPGRGLAEQALAARPVRRRWRALRDRHGLTSIVLWGPGERAAGRRGRRGSQAARPCSRRRRRLPIWSRSRAAPR